jgi:6-pyruvoyltetrahydropterin/6-carboxytetrahydropterin synthase
MVGEPDPATQILIDYSVITQVINKYDHQIILNGEDPMVSRIEEFHPVITTPGDPTSELMAVIIRDDLYAVCRELGIKATIPKIRVWESPTACAELTE